MAKWQCVKNCGACCYLNPEERPYLQEFLTPEQLELYYSLIGTDGWCIHFDHPTRQCKIYNDRPYFCRVEASVFWELYGVLPEELDEFAIECCYEHIIDIYGENSPEYQQFYQAIQ
ncbi:MAG: YkgJ family cysteine cluster protein [Pseudanabaenaceae cyanobacterium SKYGB_i_bin29]|nr:YkgJ family cysteine cluster protein [Pseudanabaenaceae cyanobacterium SKYG29]MDW8422257.1 YkgJ family cysteine cluster protein [Pseudanabaenaceae cyanobacterium SKYGB_i_bin29]